MPAESRRVAGKRSTRPTTCPKCHELLDADSLTCMSCGRFVPDPGRTTALWMRRGIIALLVLGALALVSSMLVPGVRSLV